MMSFIRRLAQGAFAALQWFAECRLQCELAGLQNGGAKRCGRREKDDLPVIGVL